MKPAAGAAAVALIHLFRVRTKVFLPPYDSSILLFFPAHLPRRRLWLPFCRDGRVESSGPNVIRACALDNSQGLIPHRGVVLRESANLVSKLPRPEMEANLY